VRGAPGVVALFITGDPCCGPARAAVIFTPDGTPGVLASPPRSGLTTKSLPLIAKATDERDSEGEDFRGGEPRHKLGGFADWINHDPRMRAYFDSDLPTSGHAVVAALEKAGVDVAELKATRDFASAVRMIRADGGEPLVLGRASDDFDLLFQIDSDAEADTCWGDVGRLFVYAPTSDVQARRFDNVVVVGDCS